jgi:hypothetical protein
MSVNEAHQRAAKIHFARQLMSRYAIECSQTVLDKMLEQIFSGKSPVVEQHSDTRTSYSVKLDGQQIVVVYSSTLETLVTALPLNCLTVKRDRDRKRWSKRNKDWKRSEDWEEGDKRPRNKQQKGKTKIRQRHFSYQGDVDEWS